MSCLKHFKKGVPPSSDDIFNIAPDNSRENGFPLSKDEANLAYSKLINAFDFEDLHQLSKLLSEPPPTMVVSPISARRSSFAGRDP